MCSQAANYIYTKKNAMAEITDPLAALSDKQQR
jgi:hypothetical protein